LEVLYKKAFETMLTFTSGKIHLRAIIEFSNYCRKNCRYCGIRRGNKDQKRYRMSSEEIISVSIEAYKQGFRTVVLQSGEDLYFTKDKIGDIIKRIKEKVDIAVTLSVGERDYETYRYWKMCGADRYLMRIETTNKDLFKKLHPDDDYEYRIRCLKWIKEFGYELGTGIMLGLPKQTLEDLANDILLFKKFDADMIGCGPFLPHNGTPLFSEKMSDVNLTLKFLAVLRLVMKDINIPATTALGTIDPYGREMGLKAGCNVLMPNFTPVAYRKHYLLYNNKICIFEDANKCYQCTLERIKNVNLKASDSKGFREHS
jgi:biotin synthase